MSMYKAKKYYVDENNNMIGYPNYVQNKTEANPMPFHSKLRMKKIGWLNSGCYYIFEDKNGKTYSMNDAMLADYIENNNLFIEGDFDFYQRGTSFSIGLEKNEKNIDAFQKSI